MTVTVVIVAALLGCVGCAGEPEPTQAEKAWHNCLEVMGEVVPDPDDACDLQRESPSIEFEARWTENVDRTAENLGVDVEDLDILR